MRPEPPQGTTPSPYISRVLEEWGQGIDPDDGREYDETRVEVAYPKPDGTTEFRTCLARCYVNYHKGPLYDPGEIMYTLTIDDDESHVVRPCPLNTQQLMTALQSF